MILADMIAAYTWTRLFREPEGEAQQTLRKNNTEHHCNLHVYMLTRPFPAVLTRRRDIKKTKHQNVDIHTSHRGWASRDAKDPRYWLEMAFSVWQTSDRILGMYGIVPCCLGTPVLYHRNIYIWSMGRLKNLDAGECAMHGVDFCMTVTSWLHLHRCAGSHQKHLPKDMNISKYPLLRKPLITEGPLLRNILQYIVAHLPKDILLKATLCLYLDDTKQDLKLNKICSVHTYLNNYIHSIT